MRETFLSAHNKILQRALFKKKATHDAVLQTLNNLGNPHKKLKYIHVAGTNGKGSVSALTAQILKNLGLKTGLYTSPHLITVCERIRINGIKISEEDFAFYAQKVFENEPQELTFFEVLTVIMFLYFADKKCDVCVIETGIGGLKDITNIIESSLVSVITWIDLDHTKLLGGSLPLIAAEKAGIIKPGGIIVCGETKYEPLKIIKQKAKELNAKFIAVPFGRLRQKEFLYNQAQTCYELDGKLTFLSSLNGDYQAGNMQTALTAAQQAAQLLGQEGKLTQKLFASSCSQIVWPARFQILRQNKKEYIIDGGHNPQALEYFVRNYSKIPVCENSVFIISMMKDKDYRQSLKALKAVVKNAVAVSVNERGLEADGMCSVLKEYGINAVASDNFENALTIAGGYDRIVVCGSFYLAGEMLKTLNFKF